MKKTHYSIHFYSAIGCYCLFYVDSTTYEIVRVFPSKFSAILFGLQYGLTVNND